MRHLEQLVYEYFAWQGYIVRHNIKVGRLKHGGYEMELDIVAYNHKKNHLIHIEPSIDSHTWNIREKRFTKKFNAGRKYIRTEVFDWLGNDTIKLEQIAVLINHPKGRNRIGAGLFYLLTNLPKVFAKELELKERWRVMLYQSNSRSYALFS